MSIHETKGHSPKGHEMAGQATTGHETTGHETTGGAAIGLRHGVRFCWIGDRAVFLDTERDRYFCLSPQLDLAFAGLASGDEVPQADRSALIEIGVLAREGGAAIRACSARPPRRDQPEPLPIQGAGRVFRFGVARALLHRAYWSRMVRKRSLARNLASLEALRETLADHDTLGQAVASVEHAYSRAAQFWGTAGQCLPTAMAILADLSSAGVHAQLVFGVQFGPFGAHSWVEVDGRPIGDDAENIARFVRIRVV